MKLHFYERGKSNLVELLISKAVNHFLVAREPSVVEGFLEALVARFILEHVKKSRDPTFLNCKIL